MNNVEKFDFEEETNHIVKMFQDWTEEEINLMLQKEIESMSRRDKFKLLMMRNKFILNIKLPDIFGFE